MRISFRATVQNREKNKPKPNPEKSAAPTDGFDVTQGEPWTTRKSKQFFKIKIVAPKPSRQRSNELRGMWIKTAALSSLWSTRTGTAPERRIELHSTGKLHALRAGAHSPAEGVSSARQSAERPSEKDVQTSAKDARKLRRGDMRNAAAAVVSGPEDEKNLYRIFASAFAVRRRGDGGRGRELKEQVEQESGRRSSRDPDLNANTKRQGIGKRELGDPAR
ncbi:hypothetical protein B0H13DRAFT_1891746 [Mycena leptocephala]|nr:hypothetical protein B0H13DRAFT_1891746 [Mycena leptocephala]